jgi:adenylate kinase
MSSKDSDYKVIIIMGPPGSGKGSQATLLADKLDFYYFETSRILEENFKNAKSKDFIKIKGKKYFLTKERDLWKTGFLLSPPLVTHLLKEKIIKLYRDGRGIILAGSPRTLYEGKEEIPLLKKLYGEKRIKIIFLDIPPEETIFRNSRRKICELMRHPILYSKETEKLSFCPLDGSRLVRREGLDDPETIKTRLIEYKEKTLPLLDYFKSQNLKITRINGSPPPDQVFKKILKVLKIK